MLEAFTLSQKVVILLSILTLMLSLGSLGQAVLAVQYSMDLPDLPTTVSLQYLAAMGGFWALVFIACSVGLSLFREWGRRCTLAAVSLYQLNVWVNRLMFSASDYARQTIPRDVALTVILLLVFWVPLSLPRVRQTFERGDEGQ